VDRIRISRLAALVLGLTSLGAVLAMPVAAADQAVTIANFSFQPATVTVQVGDSVTWTNQDGAPHTATADDGSFDSGTLSQGDTGSHTFDTAGTFAYHCEIHPNMTGSVVVQAATAGGTGGGTGGATQPPSDAADVTREAGTPWAAVLAMAALALVASGLALRLRRRAAALD
jgi:plastocyanin